MDGTRDTQVSLVDSHVHFWDPGRLDYPWLADLPALRRPFGPDELTAVAPRLTAAVFVEAGRADHQAGAEVVWVGELADRWPLLRGIVAHAPMEHGTAGAAATARLARHDLVKGVRRNVQDEAAGFTATDAFTRGVRALADHDLTFDLCVRHHQLPEVTELVRRVPQVTFVLDHLGKPPVAAAELDPWRGDLARLADAPNVVCKLSGLATEAAPDWTDADVLPYLWHALAVFGPDRCMYGGDWPVATLATGYARWLRIIHGVLAGLPEPDRRAVLADTARRVYRIED
nr:amidohydrolase family protein [Micromonospora sp. DSM 115978]